MTPGRTSGSTAAGSLYSVIDVGVVVGMNSVADETGVEPLVVPPATRTRLFWSRALTAYWRFVIDGPGLHVPHVGSKSSEFTRLLVLPMVPPARSTRPSLSDTPVGPVTCGTHGAPVRFHKPV